MGIKRRIGLTQWIAAAAVAGACSPALAGNPMDHVGVEHNAYLGCLMAQAAGGASKGSELEDLVVLCGYRPEGSAEEFVARYTPFLPTQREPSFGERVAPYRQYFSTVEYALLTRIDAALSSQAQSAAEMDKALAEIESEAIAKLDPKSQGGQAVLGGISTARHSLEYWAAHYEAQPEAGRVQAKRKWWQVVLQIVSVVGADAGCAVAVGAIPGAQAAAGPAAGACSKIVNDLW
ncbi:hypothetical protein [Lysobacter sp. 1R34A]|uniref:hypothetical protein n=1 Tax=Lysobacter sp. 1R34A TaxID=3445786 RepID=UPI003EED6EB7